MTAVKEKSQKEMQERPSSLWNISRFFFLNHGTVLDMDPKREILNGTEFRGNAFVEMLSFLHRKLRKLRKSRQPASDLEM